VVQVTARYFAAFREQAGRDSEQVETSAATAGELYSELAQRHGFRDPMSRCKLAVNDELADWQSRLRSGDTLLFFPPVAGG
jgi:molybdopterin converting factor subunit 1